MRVARSKPEPLKEELLRTYRAEFEANRHIDKKDVQLIEHLLRKGTRAPAWDSMEQLVSRQARSGLEIISCPNPLRRGCMSTRCEFLLSMRSQLVTARRLLRSQLFRPQE